MKIAPDQQPLFGAVPPPPPPAPPVQERYEAMQAAHDKASDEWKEAYEAFILSYLASHDQATGEDIRLAYEKTSLPQVENSKRASGAIFARLKREGKIREVGFKLSEKYGNPIRLYERIND